MDSNWAGLKGEIARTWRGLGVDESPLLADLKGGERSWWRFLLGIVAGMVGGLIVALIVAVLIGLPVMVVLMVQGIDQNTITSFVEDIQSTGYSPTFGTAIGLIWTLAILNGLMLTGFAWIGSLLTKRRLRLSFTTAPKWRWRHLLGGILLYGAVLGAMMAFEAVVLGHPVSLPLFKMAPTPLLALVFVAVTVPGWIIAAGVEELAFRGWLLRQSALMMRWTWLYILFNGMLFSFIHWDFIPAHFDINAFIARSVMGAGLCYMALRMGGIEFSTGAHAANNILLVMFIEPFNLAMPNGEPFDIGNLGETAVMLVLMIAVTEIAIRVPPIARLIGPPGKGAAPQADAFV
jgi:membrane protease YdiL (CAAX protease family)